jgi:hypothetical protein
MADRVHPAVHGVQPVALQAVLDRPASEFEPGELGPRHDAVLAGCKCGDRRVDRAKRRLTPYVGVN